MRRNREERAARASRTVQAVTARATVASRAGVTSAGPGSSAHSVAMRAAGSGARPSASPSDASGQSVSTPSRPRPSAPSSAAARRARPRVRCESLRSTPAMASSISVRTGERSHEARAPRYQSTGPGGWVAACFFPCVSWGNSRACPRRNARGSRPSSDTATVWYELIDGEMARAISARNAPCGSRSRSASWNATPPRDAATSSQRAAARGRSRARREADATMPASSTRATSRAGASRVAAIGR